MTQSRSRWSVIAAFSLVGASTQMVWLTFAPVTSVAAERYGVSVSAIGWLANVFVLAFVLLAIPAGLLLDRWLRPALALGGVLTAVGAALRLVGDDYTWLLIGGLVAALGQPIMLTGIAGLTRGYLAPADRAKGIALATASTWAGFIAAFALGTVFSTTSQMPALLVAQAGYAVLAAVVLLVALRAPAPFAGGQPVGDVASSLRDVRQAWGDPLVRVLCCVAFIPFGTFIALTTWTEALLKPAGVGVDQVGIILIVNIVAGVVGTATLPVWAAKHRMEAQIGLVGVAVTAAGCVAMAIAPGFVVALVALALAGFLLLPMLAVVLELIESHAGDLEGVASGLVWAIGNLGGLIVAGVVSFTVDESTLSFLLLAVVTLLAVPFLTRLGKRLASHPGRESLTH
ncbi:MFS transporter [Angustibacter sp. McL0619]|uniref:MFS transporter n=1 Tax=Angustibacter sp. McL0619 TaxID=3415676 RepID=UPI003CEEE266